MATPTIPCYSEKYTWNKKERKKNAGCQDEVLWKESKGKLDAIRNEEKWVTINKNIQDYKSDWMVYKQIYLQSSNMY